ncbi:MAG: tRNA threonylcarbamoyladenosine dehydratase [Clostridiales bacterium]|nr:tRNA threonylcarbamoyladenosine dehydratase [Clostridiales bacterium]
MERYTREIALIGQEAFDRLRRSRVAVFGVGGVGGYCAEALARAGVGHIELFDHDTVSVSNINRQIIALDSTAGQSKARVMAARIRDIDPGCKVICREVFYDAGNAADFPLSDYDYIADCIDTVSSKMLLITGAKEAGVPVICALGTGNKLHPELLEIADIHKTETCPLARIIRKKCREAGIDHLKVVYSREEPAHVCVDGGEDTGRHAPASISFVPPVAGMLMAGEIVRTLAGL